MFDYNRLHRSSEPTAQLTVFYSGMVNVYDDVPADTAQAIMVLAGSGKSCQSSPYVKASSMAVDPSSVAAIASNLELSGGMSTPATRELRVPFSTRVVVSSAISPAVSSFPARTAKQQVVQRSDSELPFARKASLTRFLDKRRRTHKIKAMEIANPVQNIDANNVIVSASDEQGANSIKNCTSTSQGHYSHRQQLHPDKS